jgi:transposase
MDVLHQRCAGMDISKSDAKVCVRVPSAGVRFKQTITTYGATRGEVLRLRDDLVAAEVSLVVMEATGDYWKPFFFVLAETLHVELVNAKQARNIPGRKTDVSDAAWLAKLAAYGLLRASFVPDEPIRQLRDLTRSRSTLAQEQVREFSRLEKVLEDTGIKLSLKASSLTTLSSRKILDALVAGQHDPVVLAELATKKMREDMPALLDALAGRFTEHHAFMVQLRLARIDELARNIGLLDTRIDEVIEPFRDARELLTTIPGISMIVAAVIIAETGGTMTQFPSPGHLASWAGVCPGQNESAGRVGSTRTRPGNRYLKAALGIAAMSASRSKHTYLAVKYRRIQARNGRRSLKALVAIEHTILVAAWKMLTTGEAWNELGTDYYDHRNPDQLKRRALHQLKALGYDIELTPAAA